MEVCNPKGGRTATPAFLAMLLMIVSMMLLNAYCCSAAVLAKSNASFRCSDGHLDECLIEEDLELELELGFLMNPYVSRILAESGVTKDTGDPNKVAACGQPQDLKKNPAYANCIAKFKPKLSDCKKENSYKRCGDEE